MPKPITPLLTADAIIELTDFPDRPILLIERANPPDGWAIPCGFVDLGEIVEQAVLREVQEEVGLKVRLITLLGIYFDPVRDSRGHMVTAVYAAEAPGTPVAADNGKNCRLFSLDELPGPLAFDHAQALADYKKYRETGQVAQLRDNPIRISDKLNKFVTH